jgi:putative acetyltransferase
MDTKIRDEEAKDIEQVRAILLSAFPTDAESKLVDALRANGKATISLVALNGDQTVGHILFSPVSTAPSSEAKGIGLAPVAMRPDVQTQGIGSRLIEEGLRRCHQLGYDFCVVLGNPRYYQRFGFQKASHFGLQNEYGVDDEFMVIRFSGHELGRGTVRYGPEFAVFSV